MTFKCIATGSEGNCYILTNNKREHLILDAGINIKDIKKGLNFDVENTKGCVITHCHKDHSLSASKVANFSPVWKPYESANKRQRTHLGNFRVECFDLPHNGCDNRGFIIESDRQKICYMTDMEYCPYDLSDKGINILVVECNYISELVNDDSPNERHKVLGHCELNTTIGIIKMCSKHLRSVFLVHASKGSTMDKGKALNRIKEQIPAYIKCEFVKENTEYDISECPF